MDQDYYKALWVDDDDSFIGPIQIMGRKKYGLQLVRFSNWEEAKEELNANFEDYSAIILDANCKINQDSLEEGIFIPVILLSAFEIFTRKQKYIPWYIYSAGTMVDFDFVVNAAGVCREDFKDEWGDMLFRKYVADDAPDGVETLLDQIKKVAERQFQNSVLYKHKEMFKYLGKDKAIDSREARRYMLKMLDALYTPENDLKFQYEGNPIRKVLEYMFWAAKKRGLLPEECFNERGVALQNARKFMEGKTIPIAEDGEIVYKVRWGKNREKIFDDDVAKGVQIILDFANSDSHVDDEYVDEETPYFVNEDKKEMFFSYVMQLCYVIRWFGKYVGKHPDAGKNREKHSFLDYTPLTREDVIGKKALVRNEGEYYRAWRCKLSEECNPSKIVGKQCVIEEVMENTEADNKLHPFIATKITPVTEE